MKKEKNQLNNKGQSHGYWEKYYLSGNTMWEGNYINVIYNGIWKRYDENGNISYIEFFSK